MKDNQYYLVKKKALPEVLLKVVEAKKLLESGRIETINDATEMVGISRSSFYKYKDDIFPFQDQTGGKTITFVLQVEDTPGLLSEVLRKVAEYSVNILTIHQTIPINGVASLTLSAEVLETSGNASEMLQQIEMLEGVHYLKILARE